MFLISATRLKHLKRVLNTRNAFETLAFFISFYNFLFLIANIENTFIIFQFLIFKC